LAIWYSDYLRLIQDTIISYLGKPGQINWEVLHVNKYAVYGWCTTEIQVLAGTIETKGLTLRETFNLASQIFIYPEGIYIRRIYDSEM
jgi:hypothetical protein